MALYSYNLLKYYVGDNPLDEVIFWQLGTLVKTGSVKVVHPLMYFAERLGRGYEQATRATWPIRETKAGVGCLLVLAGVEKPGRLEILEAGVIYADLLRNFEHSKM